MRRWMLAGLAAMLLPVSALAAATASVAECGVGVAIGAERVAAARDALRLTVSRGFAPGAVLMVRRNGRTLISEAIGLSDSERRTPMRADALFRLYSMTKPITTVAAMQLIEDGRMSLDDPVAKYIPAFANTPVFVSGDAPASLKVEPQRRPLTIRDLMRHTAGMTYKADGPTAVHRLYAARGIDTGSGADIAPLDGSPRAASSTELADRIAGIPLLHQPGARYSYGNAVDVLGRVVEVASGEPLGAFVARRIFGPLKMRDTGFVVPERDRARFTAAYGSPSLLPADAPLLARIDIRTATPRPLTLADDPARSPYRARRPIDYGGAGLVGTAADYMRFAEAMRRSGALDGARILRPSSVAKMRVNQLPEGARTAELADVGLGFGLGFAVRDAEALQPMPFPRCGYFWAGAASTYFWIDPANGITGVFMTQVFGGDVRSVWIAVLEALYGPAKAG